MEQHLKSMLFKTADATISLLEHCNYVLSLIQTLI